MQISAQDEKDPAVPDAAATTDPDGAVQLVPADLSETEAESLETALTLPWGGLYALYIPETDEAE